MVQVVNYSHIQSEIQVETAVTDMRDVFTSALSALKTMQNDDEQLLQKVDDHKKEHERQLSQVVRMVLALKVSYF